MKRVIYTVILFLLYINVYAQCKGFAKNVCKLELLPYIHDGIYNATILSEGETAKLYKTFYSGQQYRLVICGDENLPDLKFKVLDGSENVLYDNSEHGLSQFWDFKLEASQQLQVVIQVPTSDELTEKLISGCVAVLVGFMHKESSFDQME